MSPAAFDPRRIIDALARHDVRYVGIGMFAAYLQGVPSTTQDLDITPSRTVDNLDRLAAALRELGARFRVGGYPDGYVPDAPLSGETFRAATSLAFATDAGPVDVALMPDGTGGYDDLVRNRVDLVIDPASTRGGLVFPAADLRDIARSKRAAARPKDRVVMQILDEAIRDRPKPRAGAPSPPTPTPAGPVGVVESREPASGLPPLTRWTCFAAACAGRSEDGPLTFSVAGGPDVAPTCPACGTPAQRPYALTGTELAREHYRRRAR